MEADSAIPRLTLPTCFGLDKLYEPFYNNVFFVLQNGRKMGAAALMLGIHSPVLEQKYIKPGIKEIDVQDFAAETVVMFVEAMYNGIFAVTIENFRDLHKLCSVFEVNWMVARCIQFFQDLSGKADSVTMSLLFEEAMWACEKIKSDVLFDIWREAMAAKKDPEMNCNTYIKRYIEGNYEELSVYTLKKLIAVTDDHVVFVDLISSRIRVTNVKMDKTSRFLLLNINLSMCMETCLDEVTELFDVFLQDVTSPDFIMINNLHRQTSKAYIEKLKMERANLSAVTTQESPNALCSQSIPNMFHVFHVFHVLDEVVPGTNVEITLEHVADVSCNLYMLLEYMARKGEQVTDSVLEKLRELMRVKGWNPVHPEFVDSLLNMSDESRLMSSNSADITS